MCTHLCMYTYTQDVSACNSILSTLQAETSSVYAIAYSRSSLQLREYAVVYSRSWMSAYICFSLSLFLSSFIHRYITYLHTFTYVYIYTLLMSLLPIVYSRSWMGAYINQHLSLSLSTFTRTNIIYLHIYIYRYIHHHAYIYVHALQMPQLPTYIYNIYIYAIFTRIYKYLHTPPHVNVCTYRCLGF